MAQSDKKTTIIFVCLGNYCRSPMAEAIFRKRIKDADLKACFEISSAGTRDWDVGLRPDPRAKAQLDLHGYSLDSQKRARQITPIEITKADYVIAMTARVASELGDGENVHLLMSFVPGEAALDIPDPYPSDSFPEAFEKIERGIKAFVRFLEKGRTLH